MPTVTGPFPQVTTQATVSIAGTQNTLVVTLNQSIDLQSLYALLGGILQQVGHPAAAQCSFGTDGLGNVTITIVWTTIP